MDQTDEIVEMIPVLIDTTNDHTEHVLIAL